MEAYFSGDIPPLKKVEAFLYGNCGGTFSFRAYLHSKKVEAFLYGNCNVALKFHIIPVEAYVSGDIPPLKKWRHSYMEIVEAHFQLGHTCTLKKWRHSYMEIVM